MVKSIASAPFYLVLLVLLLLFLSSCGFVHKVFDKNKTHKETTSVVVSDSTVLKKQDESRVITADSTGVKKTGDQKQNDVEVEFADSSAQNHVEVITDSEGHHKVVATGKIKSLRTRTQAVASTVDSTHTISKDQSSKTAIDSASVSSSSNNTAVEDSKQVSREKRSWKIPWYGYVLFLLFLVLLVIYLRYRKQINSFISKLFKSNQSTMKILLLIAAAYLLSGCSNTPDNNVKGIKIEQGGYKPGASVNNRPVQVSDTQVLLSPTWGQARHFASKRGDHWIWVLIQVVLIAAFFIVLYGQIRDATWLPQQLSGTWLLFVLGALFLASNWQSAAIKWENDVYVPKAQYDRAIKESGSTKPIWDSLENSCHIIWGPYGCYK